MGVVEGQCCTHGQRQVWMKLIYSICFTSSFQAPVRKTSRGSSYRAPTQLLVLFAHLAQQNQAILSNRAILGTPTPPVMLFPAAGAARLPGHQERRLLRYWGSLKTKSIQVFICTWTQGASMGIDTLNSHQSCVIRCYKGVLPLYTPGGRSRLNGDTPRPLFSWALEVEGEASWDGGCCVSEGMERVRHAGACMASTGGALLGVASCRSWKTHGTYTRLHVWGDKKQKGTEAGRVACVTRVQGTSASCCHHQCFHHQRCHHQCCHHQCRHHQRCHH